MRATGSTGIDVNVTSGVTGTSRTSSSPRSASAGRDPERDELTDGAVAAAADVERRQLAQEHEDRDADDDSPGRAVWAVRTNSGMSGGQACESGTARSTPTKAHSGRSNSQSSAGPDHGHAGRDPGQEPDPPRGAVPELGGEVGEGQDHERQARVVVVLERRPVDPGP